MSTLLETYERCVVEFLNRVSQVQVLPGALQKKLSIIDHHR